MAKQTYLGAVSGRDRNFSIVFRDFPGCASAGETVEEALAMGAEALAGHIEVMRDYGDPVPAPTIHDLADVEAWLYDAEDVERDPWVGLFPIEIDMRSRGETGHGDINVELPRSLMRDIDAAGPDARQFVIDAARRELLRLKKSA